MKREENQTVEYKESWHEKYLEWICGYANAKGGTLYVGIEDGTKRPVGLKNPNKLMEDIPNTIRNTMGIVADVALLKKSGKDVIRVKVKPSAFPVSYHGGFHYRTGSVKMQLTGPALTQFLMEKSGQEWDAVPSLGGFKVKDFTLIALKNAYRKAKGRALTGDDLVSFGLATETGILTNTGALLADECPIAHSRIFCTRWNGLDMTAGVMDAADDQEFSGGLLQLLKYGEDFVRLHSRRAWHKRPTDRVNFYEYPMRSITEMLINGLIHRSYLEYGSEVHVDMFDDRIEITSPGGMPGERRVQDYPNARRIPSKRRNKTLSDVFERIDLMERKGSGFKKLFEDYERIAVNPGRRLPQLESEVDYFRVTLPNLLYGFTDDQLVAEQQASAVVPSVVSGDGRSKTYHDAYHVNDHENRPLTTSEFRLLTVLGQHGALSAADLRKAMKIKNSSDLRERYLRPLSRQGYVEFTIPGAARSRLQNYRLTDKGKMILMRNSASPCGSNVESGNIPVMPPVVTPVVPPVVTPVTPPVVTPVELPSEALLDDVQRKVLLALVKGEMATVMLAKTVGVTQAKNLRRRYLRLLLDARYIEYTIPAKPNSRLQQYRLTDKGRMFAERIRTAKKKGKSK